MPTVSLPGFVAPFLRPFLLTGASAALSSSHDVCGVRMSKWNDRSGRTVTRHGIGVPGVNFSVRALNSCNVLHASQHAPRPGRVVWKRLHTLQKSIDLTPLLPSAGPTGGLGLACPAPTMSLMIWLALPAAPLALDMAATM